MSTPSQTPAPTEWHGFKAGDRVVMLIETMGETDDGDEVVFAAGTTALIDQVDWFGPSQGSGVHMTIGTGDLSIVNVFDDEDVGFYGHVPFTKVEAR